jgi:hypothetical protein
MQIKFDTKMFDKQMKNFIDYSVGFLQGIDDAKPLFLENFGKGIITALSAYIDSHARSQPQTLHHVYEWYKTGSPAARLFNLEPLVTNGGIYIKSSFKQSTTLPKDSKQPFYNKATIMENRTPVTIKPKNNVLVFEADGQTVFTKKKITVTNPGGNAVAGSYEKCFDEFFSLYFKQSFLKSSGILDHLENLSAYKINLPSGIKGGKSAGINVGYKWLINAKVGVE